MTPFINTAVSVPCRRPALWTIDASDNKGRTGYQNLLRADEVAVVSARWVVGSRRSQDRNRARTTVRAVCPRS